MKRKTVRLILSYYRDAPKLMKLLEAEKNDLLSVYNSLRSPSFDAMPSSPEPGNPVPALAEQIERSGVRDRAACVDVKICVLSGDVDAVNSSLDALNSLYRRLLVMKYLKGFTWAKISVSLGVPDGTVRHWHDRALERLGEALDDLPMADEIAARAFRSRM